MKGELWIKNGIVLTEKGLHPYTIKVEEGRIAALFEHEPGPLLEPGSNCIDAIGCLVVPGFIDAHVHFNDPGRTDWEGIETGSRAAAAGGTTTVFDMPLNSSPSVLSPETLRYKKEYLAGKSFVDYALWGGMTSDSLKQNEELRQMADGVIAWKAFMCESGIEDFSSVSGDWLRQAMKAASEQGKILALHAEWGEEIETLGRFFRKQFVGVDERRAFLLSRPISSELEAVSEAIDLAAKYGTTLHFVHISSPEAVSLIQQAKGSGVDATVETCPHYLVFDEEDFIKKGAVLKCAPPLRKRQKVEGLWECLEKGWIDTIGSDHSPCLYSMKDTDSIWEAWGGIQGVQFTWLALLDGALKRGIPLSKVLPLGSSNVADRFGLRDKKGRIQPGLDADLVMLSLDETTIAYKSTFEFRNKFSPYEDMTFLLKVKKTFLRGEVIYDDQTGVCKEKQGQLLTNGKVQNGTASR